MKKIILLILLVSLTKVYSQNDEIIMPFNNMIALGNRMTPLQSKNVEFGIRIWVNIGTSIDRVITITKSYDFENETHGYIHEISTISNQKGLGYYKTIEAEPRSGYEDFLVKLDSINLFSYCSQKSFEIVANHSPLSVFMFEIKDKQNYNFFEFNTYWPHREYAIDEKYQVLIDLIVKEFDLNI